ncbi:MAG: ribbon-helix-helix domain-containing protein [Nitrospiraceae bacterium]|nr:ribbon-helix-helix domain-containing protein [Nitrospiraceae bacterium]
MSDRRTYSVRLRPEIIKKLRILAVESEKQPSILLEEAIEDLLKKHSAGKKGKKEK